MNHYDSDKISDILLLMGYHRVDSYLKASIIVLNTCHIRHKATEKMYSKLGEVRKKTRPQRLSPLIIVAGCTAQAEGQLLFQRNEQVRIVVGPQAYHQLPQLIKRAKVCKQLALDFKVIEKFDHLPKPVTSKSSALLSIQEGCDKFCSFCVVPYTRGPELSRPVRQIVAEATQLSRKGALEITLLGQNVNAYNGQGYDGKPWTLAQLLHLLHKTLPLKRLSYMTSHPLEMTQDLITAHRDIPVLIPYLHLPVQSGANRVLKAMNRRYTAQQYAEIIAQMRSLRPDMAISSDFIVGFPGETEKEFLQTISLVEKISFSHSFSFTFSPRPGTKAATLENPVPEQEKRRRLLFLQEVLAKQAYNFNKSFVGKTLPVLFQYKDTKKQLLKGKSSYMHNVHLPLNSKYLNKILPVQITSTSQHALKAVLT